MIVKAMKDQTFARILGPHHRGDKPVGHMVSVRARRSSRPHSDANDQSDIEAGQLRDTHGSARDMLY